MSFSGIDLFSSSFNFNVGGSKIQKGTRAGQIFTFIVIILTLSYFIYLFKLYFSNQLEPTYRAQNIINNQTQSIDIQQNIYGIKLNYAQPTSQVLKYGIIQIQGTYANDTNSQLVYINTKSCQDPNLKDFKCLDEINYLTKEIESDIKNKNYNYKLTSIEIVTYSCNDNSQNCASQQDIDKALNGGEIVLKMQLSYFDIYKKKVVQSYQTLSIFISTDQTKTSNIKLQNQKASIKDGLFIQDESIFIMPTNYNIDNQSVNKQNLGISAYSIINMKVDQIYQEASIQYQTVPQVIAQVSSVFNILIFAFFFMKYVSQSSLQNDLFMILMKSVYQDIYQHILKLNGFQNLNLQENYQKPTQNNNSEKQVQRDKIEIPGVFDFIELENVQKRENEFFGKNEYLKSIGIKQEHKKKIEGQLKKDLDILQFYKDIIFLKKAVMMILSQDQLASLKYIGCSTSLLDQKQTLTDIENDKLSHYEKQTEILNSQDLQYQHTLSFLERCSDKGKMTEVDIRILKSISRSYFS